MRNYIPLVFSVSLCLCGSSLRAEAPVASYIFPAGGQRGQAVNIRVGGLFLHHGAHFEMLGAGVSADKQLRPMKTLWFEGPVLPLPESQQAEDYPRDQAGVVKIAADASLGARGWRLSTAQGATPSLKFMVGDLPEVLEDEEAGGPVAVTLPVTINGRIFPRENVDAWTFQARKGQSIVGTVHAARLGTPLDARLEVRDAQGRRLAENDDHAGADPQVRFTAPADGRYEVRIHDTQFHGGPAYVYRLTLTADPVVERAYPLGGRRGRTTAFTLTGQGVPEKPVSIALPADGPRDYAHQLESDGKRSRPFVLDLDDLPEHLEGGAQQVDAPAVLNGRIDQPGDVDLWKVPCRKGEPLDLAVRARRLGSPLYAVLTISDDAGKELARAESGDGRDDPWLRFQPPADGVYTIRVQERFRARGGPEYAYRLRIAPPSLDDIQLRLVTDAVTLPRGGQAKLRVLAETIVPAPVQLELDGLPAGVSAAPVTMAVNTTTAEFALKAEASAKIDATRLTVRGTAKLGDQTLTRTATLPLGPGLGEVDTVLLGVALPAPFKIVGNHEMRWAPRGCVLTRRYRIERNGFDGPIEVSLADRQARHLQGATGPVLTVPAGAAEFEYPVQLAPWMETGRTCRVCVMGLGIVKDADGAEHTVSFSSVQPNEQVIVVVEPERLGLTPGQASLTAAPGQAVDVAWTVARGKGLQGPVKIELLNGPRGISADPIEIAAGVNQGKAAVRVAADYRGPARAPLTFRATLVDGTPVIAEARIDLRTSP